jgi:hypothetical protein
MKLPSFSRTTTTTTTTTTLDAPRSAGSAAAKTSEPAPTAPAWTQAQDSFERIGTKSAGSAKKIDDPSSVHDGHTDGSGPHDHHTDNAGPSDYRPRQAELGARRIHMGAARDL